MKKISITKLIMQLINLVKVFEPFQNLIFENILKLQAFRRNSDTSKQEPARFLSFHLGILTLAAQLNPDKLRFLQRLQIQQLYVQD